jgi:hypothetical protein
MFNSISSILGFLAGTGLTIGLLISPHLVPGGWGYLAGRHWPIQLIGLAAVAGLTILTGTLWLGGRLIRTASDWKEPRVIVAVVMIAIIANTLFMFLVECFGLSAGWRALVAVLGVPVIYGNLGRVLGKTSLTAAMVNIFTGALATLGAGFILAAILKGW